MKDHNDLIDLREAVPEADPEAPDAIRILAEVLAGARSTAYESESSRAGSSPVESSPAESTPAPVEAAEDEPDPTETPDQPGGDLRGIESLPRALRRRIDMPLAEGEQVECAIRGVPDVGAEWVLATSHRIVVDEPSTTHARGAMSLPYHRTTVSLTDDGRLHLRCDEFGRARCTSFEPARGYSAEADHLVKRLSSH